jgi:hypothetical protein
VPLPSLTHYHIVAHSIGLRAKHFVSCAASFTRAIGSSCLVYCRSILVTKHWMMFLWRQRIMYVISSRGTVVSLDVVWCALPPVYWWSLLAAHAKNWCLNPGYETTQKSNVQSFLDREPNLWSQFIFPQSRLHGHCDRPYNVSCITLDSII